MPSHSVNLLRGIIGANSGLALQNRYEVILPTTNMITQQGQGETHSPSTNEMENMNIMCRSVNMPGKQILSLDRAVSGTFQKIAYGFAAEDITLQFTATADLSIKGYFQHWQNQAFDMSDNGKRYPRPKYKSNYVHDVKIYQLDKNGDRGYGIELVDAYPTTVNAINYSDGAEGPIDFSVQLSYKKWNEIE